MSINNLLAQVDNLKEEEKKKISDSHKKEMEKIDGEFEAKVKSEEETLSGNLSKERERLLLLHRQSKEFDFKMKELDKKEEFAEEVEEEIRRVMSNLSFSEKKKLFLEKVGNVRSLFSRADQVRAGSEVAGRAEEILREANIAGVNVLEDGNLDFFGFVLESDDFNLELSLEKMFADFRKKEASRIANEVFNV